MEEDDEFEILRLKKLLEDSLLKVEKENLELIQSHSFDPALYSKDAEVCNRKQMLPTSGAINNKESIQSHSFNQTFCSKGAEVCNKKQTLSTSGTTNNKVAYTRSTNCMRKPTHSVAKDVKTCPHNKETTCTKHYDLESGYGNQHSRIHFINELQSSLLSTNIKRRILLNDSRSKYIPCAVPLSPPIRIKREDNIPFINQNQPPKNYVSENNSSEIEVTQYESSADYIHQNHPVKHFEPQVFPNKKLVIQNLPSISITGGKENTSSSCFKKLTIETLPSITVTGEKEKTPSPILRQKIAMADKVYSSSSSLLVTKELSENVSDGITKGQDFSTFRSFDGSFLSGKSNTSATPSQKRIDVSSSEVKVPTSNQAEDFSQGKEINHGLNFHISLDSCSTKDVINKILQKIPDILSQTDPSPPDTDGCKSGTREQAKNDAEHQQAFESKSSNFTNSYQVLERPVHIVSSIAQTDPVVEESVNKAELYNLVKETVLETLKDIPYLGYNSDKIVTPCQKVDSGIQSEVENEVTDVEKNVSIQFPSKGVLLDSGNITACQENMLVSKGTQVSLDCIHNGNTKGNLNTSYNKEKSDFTDISEENCIESVTEQTKEVSMLSERNASYHEASKIDSMLEKIYQHVCQENKPSTSHLASPVKSPFLTRDVAVQFNPLHTCNKSTITLEIKTTDSSSQYDIPQVTKPILLPIADVSVQTIELQNYQQTDAFTQCEPKIFSNSVAQTELLLNYEYSATNTSVSSTPVSDSMFMDDLLSEGETFLPWNLRLLSLSDKSGSMNMNTADSSDISIKEKDYSLSEGEIHPNILNYLNIPQNSHTEENDHLDAYPNTFSATKYDSEKHFGQSLTHNKGLRLHLSTSSLSEGELISSTSLSLGEVSSDIRNSFAETHLKLGPSSSSPQDCDKIYCDLNSTYMQDNSAPQPSTSNLIMSRNEQDKQNSNVEIQCQNLPQILQTVDEEVYEVSD